MIGDWMSSNFINEVHKLANFQKRFTRQGRYVKPIPVYYIYTKQEEIKFLFGGFPGSTFAQSRGAKS